MRGPAWWVWAVSGGVVFGLPDGSEGQTPRAIVRAYREAHEAEIVRGFADLLALPNVAADSAGIRRTAAAVRDAFAAVGVATELWDLPEAPHVPPIVYGERLVPGATRTLGIYVHYDGQPVDPDRWTNGPWTPTLYTDALSAGGTPIGLPASGDPVDPAWRIYARSAGDDKAPLGAMLPVLRAFGDHGIAPTSNLKFFFEGEEEAGSDHLRTYLERHRDRLDDIDVWLFFDGPVHQSGRPQVTYGVRGMVGLELTVYGAVRPLHSGHYGNWAPVPGQLLAELLAGMKDDEGTVTVAGFYDSVEPLGDAERAALAALPPYDAELRAELGLGWTEGAGATLAERLLLPSLTVRGMSSGNVGTRARNVIPATATAALGVRLVKGNEPDAMLDLVEAHVAAQGYHIVREDPDHDTRMEYPRIAKVVRGTGYPAARTDMSLPVVRAVTGAITQAAGDLIQVPALGGSLPLYLFTEVMGKPAMVVPIANHDNNQHAADENLRIANLWYGIDLYAALFTMPPAVTP